MGRAAAFETVVGFVVIAAAAAFMVYAYGVTGAQIGRDQYTLDAVFGRIDGVTVGSEVRIAGVKIGAVSAQDLDPQTYEANVRMAIDRGVQIPEDSVAKIVSDSLLGGAHVSIEPGASDEMLREGDKITITRGSVDLLNLAVQSLTAPSGKDGGDDDQGQSQADPLGD